MNVMDRVAALLLGIRQRMSCARCIALRTLDCVRQVQIARITHSDWLAFRRCLSTRCRCLAHGRPRIWEAPMSPLSPLRALRVILIAVLLLGAVLPAFASAASPTPPAGNSSVAELEQLVQTLKDDKERQAFVAQLETLIGAQRALAAKSADREDLVSVLSDRINAIGDEVLAGAAVLVD